MTTIDTKLSSGIYTKSFIVAIYGILVESDILPHKNLSYLGHYAFYSSLICLLFMSLLIILAYHTMRIGRGFLSEASKSPRREIINLRHVINERKIRLDLIHKLSLLVSIFLVAVSVVMPFTRTSSARHISNGVSLKISCCPGGRMEMVSSRSPSKSPILGTVG